VFLEDEQLRRGFLNRTAEIMTKASPNVAYPRSNDFFDTAGLDEFIKKNVRNWTYLVKDPSLLGGSAHDQQRTESTIPDTALSPPGHHHARRHGWHRPALSFCPGDVWLCYWRE